MQCCTCASDCKTFTTNLRKHEELNMRPRMKRLFWIAPLAILGMAVFVFIGGQIVLHLWNWLLPPLLGWHAIGFWQALGILVLCRILFGGLGFGPHRSGIRRRMEERFGQRMAARWANMTEEEREQFRQQMRGRWGCGPSTGESKQQ